jgi:ribonuclease VapC
LLSAFSALETSIVIEVRKGESGSLALAQLLYRAKIEIVEMNKQQMQLALFAKRKFGKGHHPAKLNLGDCCSYALAKYSGEPLLFKGNDFSQTDIKAVELE